MIHIGQRIKAFVDKRGIQVEDLEKLWEVGYSTVYNQFNSPKGNTDYIQLLCERYGADPAQFFQPERKEKQMPATKIGKEIISVLDEQITVMSLHTEKLNVLRGKVLAGKI
jgi:hypothetical protein